MLNSRPHSPSLEGITAADPVRTAAATACERGPIDRPCWASPRLRLAQAHEQRGDLCRGRTPWLAVDQVDEGFGGPIGGEADKIWHRLILSGSEPVIDVLDRVPVNPPMYADWLGRALGGAGVAAVQHLADGIE